MNPKETCILALLTAAIVGSSITATNAQTIPVLHDTILLDNGGGDSEDNFGGRPELIFGSNIGNLRDVLLRFDVSPVASAINDPNQVVASAQLVLNEREGRTNPTAPVQLEVYPLVPENANWVEGTHMGSQAGLSGQPGSVSKQFLATPSSHTIARGSPNNGRRWFSAGGGPTTAEIATPFSVGTDTAVVPIGNAEFNTPDAAGNFFIDLRPAAVDALLQGWLAAPTTNPGIVIRYVSGVEEQWFFESKDGKPAESARLVLTFGPPPVKLCFTDISVSSDGSIDLTWESTSTAGTTYNILYNTNLTDPFEVWGEAAAGVPDQGESTTFRVTPDLLPSPIPSKLFFVVTQQTPEPG